MNDPVVSLASSTRDTSIDRSWVTDISAILLIRLVSILVVNPAGNFPLLDDWSFGRTVKHLMETSDYHPIGWGVMTLATNVFWGTLFCLPTGFSFTALRISSLVASGIGMIGAYVLLRGVKQPRWFAILVALTLGFGPFYYLLSNTFMTDVLFSCLVTWSAIFFVQNFKKDSNLSLVIATLLATAATLSRQLALCVPFAFSAGLLLTSKLDARVALRSILPPIACAGAYLSFQTWLKATGRIPWHWGRFNEGLLKSLTDLSQLTKHVIDHTSFTLINLGLICLPILPFFVLILLRRNRKRTVVAALAGLATILLLDVARLHFDLSVMLPVYDNVMVKSGVGPTMLHDVFDLRLDNLAGLSFSFWAVVTAAATVGATLVLTVFYFRVADFLPSLAARSTTSPSGPIEIFLGVCSILYVLLLLPSYFFFDRYVTPLVPLVAAGFSCIADQREAILCQHVRVLKGIAFVLLIAFGLFAMGTTRDYLTWNRVRWYALQNLMDNDHISVTDIDGGFEFNGLYHYFQPGGDFKAELEQDAPDKFVIAFGPIPGYVVYREYTYRHWLPPHAQSLVVLKKK